MLAPQHEAKEYKRINGHSFHRELGLGAVGLEPVPSLPSDPKNCLDESYFALIRLFYHCKYNLQHYSCSIVRFKPSETH